jgi:hypothetical protein
MPIRDALVRTCAACERRFDINYAARMQARQEIHELEQMHAGPCNLLLKHYEPRGRTVELYDTPWEDQPKLVFFHSDECEEAYIHADSFGYRDCESCGRTICQQHPGNGWQWQFREHEDLGETCLKCYQDEILENGQPRSDFESVPHQPAGKIKGGMFFSWGNTEPKEAGFEEVDGFDNYFVQDRTHAVLYNERALQLIDAGRRVLTGFERMAIGGLEGYITLMVKPEEDVQR